MHLSERSEENVGKLLERVLSLSFRISRFSPPMKPFIRFSQDTDELFRTAHFNNRSLFWDFDDALQRILLNIVRAVSTPDQLAHACIERWKINLAHFYELNQKQFKEFVTGKKPYQYREDARSRFILERLDEQSYFLYIGCGRGTECLSLAKRGHNVIGIDTIFPLTKMANAWSRQLALPFKAICMDVMDLGFAKETFDSFIIEFYGHQPSLYQSLFIQRNLARVLRKGAKGFIVGCRKKYASYWFLMGKIYPTSMFQWLAKQAVFDYHWDKSDGHEEKLTFGLYYTSHTVDSLSEELGYAFNVRECLYAKDPRYIICVVEPKENLYSLPDQKYSQEWEGNVSNNPKLGEGSIDGILDQIESICTFLESHESNMLQYFNDDAPMKKSPLQSLPTEVLEFLRLLKAAFRSLPDFNITSSPNHHPAVVSA